MKSFKLKNKQVCKIIKNLCILNLNNIQFFYMIHIFLKLKKILNINNLYIIHNIRLKILVFI